MNKYKESIQVTERKIISKLKQRNNIVIIGDNSTGKSDILKRIVHTYMHEDKEVFFIDAVNRKFDVSKVTFQLDSRIEKNYSAVDYFSNQIEANLYRRQLLNIYRDVVQTRLSEENFNLQDSFGRVNQVEEFYEYFKIELQDLLAEVFEQKLEIVRKTINELAIERNILYINDEEALLSNGYQGILRLLLELLCYEWIIQEKGITEAVVVIDEIDKYLSPSYTAKIFPFLYENFPKFTLCVTTHSKDLLKYASDYILCPLSQDKSGKVRCEFISSRDMENEKRIETIFADLFFEDERIETSSNSEIDTILRQFLNLKLTDSWDEDCEKDFMEIEEKSLSPHQKLIYRQIKEW